MNFPDKTYLENLLRNLRARAESRAEDELLLMYSGALLNWVGDFLTDEGVVWEKRELVLDDLYLTGTGPEWNKIIIDRCERSPEKLRELFTKEPETAEVFKEATSDPAPILVRVDEGILKVLDGMERVIAAIRDGKTTIEAYVGTLSGKPTPHCEPHVVYDLLRAYQRGANRDREGLITALKFLRGAYTNVDGLLRDRFSKSWLPDDEIQEIIREALKN